MVTKQCQSQQEMNAHKHIYTYTGLPLIVLKKNSPIFSQESSVFAQLNWEPLFTNTEPGCRNSHLALMLPFFLLGMADLIMFVLARNE